MSSRFSDTYRLRASANIRADVAEAAAQTFSAIYHARGIVEPQDVVDVARDEAHPLHGQFEWDDGVAAEEHRKQQARRLIRCFIMPASMPKPADAVTPELFVTVPPGERAHADLPRVGEEVETVYGQAFVSVRENVGTVEEPVYRRGYKPADVVMKEPKSRLAAMADFVDRIAGDVAYGVAAFPELDFLQGAVDEAKAVVQRLQEEA